ncbi:Uncharacterized protein DAT39_005403 [Clarias magur]|uniref:Uncharacterized protein n=1 Tax=Clarias magur TaxID=1594786 RepID=A0A8J4U5A4_CLAMG|nr:Uncharacterized protein DAT39_005403 [Clarias magur]
MPPHVNTIVTFGMYTADSSGLEPLRLCSPVLCSVDMPAVCPWALTQLSSLCDGVTLAFMCCGAGDIGVGSSLLS